MIWLVVVLSIASAGCLVEAKPNPNPEPQPTFWDAVPVVSQAKMAFLYVIGDSEEAEQTWSNFKNMSHLWENVKDMDNSIPGYGQAKSLIVLLNGDEERSIEIGLAAHKSTCIVGGFMLGGPAGALAGALAADASSSLALKKPVGVIEHALHFQNKTASEHIDAVLDLTLLATPVLAGKGKAVLASPSRHNVRFNMAKNQYISPSKTVTSSGLSVSSKSIHPESPKVAEAQVPSSPKIQHPEAAETPKTSLQQPEQSASSSMSSAKIEARRKSKEMLNTFIKLEADEQRRRSH